MSWEEMDAIAREYAFEANQERSRPPVACELCGEPLRSADAGGLFCPFDGWSPTS